MTYFFKKNAQTISSVMVSLLLFGVLFYSFSMKKILTNFQNIQLFFIFPILLCCFVQNLLNSARLYFLLRQLSHCVSFERVFLSQMQGALGGSLLGGVVGEVFFRGLSLKLLEIPLRHHFAIMVIEKGTTILALFLFTGVSIFFIDRQIFFKSILFPFYFQLPFILGMTGGIAVVGIFILKKYLEKPVFQKKIFLLKRSLSSTTIFLTVLGQIFFYISVFFAIYAFEDLRLIWDRLIFYIPIVVFLSAVPLSINGWGVRESVWSFIISAYSIDGSIGVALGVLVGSCAFSGVLLSFFAAVISRVCRLK